MNETTLETKRIAGTMLAFCVSGAGCLALGSLVPFFRSSYALSYDTAGVLVSLQSVGNLCAIGLMGFLPTFFGRRKSVLMTAFWMAAAYLVFTTGLGGGALLSLACFCMGIAKGGNANFANTMMSTLPGKKASIGYNLAHGAYAVGALLSPLLIVACTAKTKENWHLATGIIFVLCLVQLVDYLRFPLPPEKREKSVRSMDKSFLKQTSFYLASAILFCYVSTEYAINGWLVTYFQDLGLLSDTMAQMMSSLLWLLMFLGRMLGAAVVGKISRDKLLIADGIGLLICFVWMLLSKNQTAIVCGIIGVGLFQSTIYTSAMALGTEAVRGNDLGVSWMILAGSAGGIITPALVGFVAERAGIRAGMTVVAVMTALLLVAIVTSVIIKGGNEE